MMRRARVISILFAMLTSTACGGGEPAELTGYPTSAGDPHDDESAGDFGEPSDDPSVGQVEDAAPPPPVDAGASAPPAPAGPERADSPVPGKVVTYPYGVKNSRYAAGYHTGEDYAAAVGLDVVAVRKGKIVWSNDNGGAYGKWMGLEADNGRTYVYCHLSSRLLSTGTTVTAGQKLGKVGATGNVTGPHLHFEDHPKGPFKYADVRKPQW
jgi:murein DD-endopeptidase MepM/ murein hydrolase activator NlpD